MPRLFPLLLLVLTGAPNATAGRAGPATVISVSFEGNRTVDAGRLKSNLRFCREGALFQPAGLDDDVRRVGTYYQDAGFLRARVGPAVVRIETVPGRGEGAVIRIPVEEGPQFVLGEVTVRNARAFRTATLLQMLPLRPGQPYNRGKMAEWRDKILDSYQTIGYIRMQADLREELRDVRRVVDCILECKEGNPYRVRSIVIEGDPSIDRGDFKRHLLVGEGGVYNPEMLVLSLHFLNEMRVFAPLSQSDVDVKIDDAAGVVDLVFRVTRMKRAAPSM